MDILRLQETWLTVLELDMVSSVAEDVEYVSVSPMEAAKIQVGRPYGGVALLWHKCYQHVIFPVCTVSERIVAVKSRQALIGLW